MNDIKTFNAMPGKILPNEEMHQIYQNLQKLIINATREIIARVESSSDDLQQKVNAKLENIEQRLEDKFQQMRKELKEDLSFQVQGLQQQMAKENQKMKEELDQSLKQLAKRFIGMEEKVKALEMEAREEEEKRKKLEDMLISSQFRELERAIRIRGLPESKNEKMEDLRESILSYLSQTLKINKQALDLEIDRIYRVNSKAAMNKKVARDAVVHFVKKSIRDMVIQEHYGHKFKYQNQEILILKEIPADVMRKRRDYYSLTDELKKRGISYKWEIPQGLGLIFKGQRYKINSPDEARDFQRKLSETPLFKDDEQLEKVYEKRQQEGSHQEEETDVTVSKEKSEAIEKENLEGKRMCHSRKVKISRKKCYLRRRLYKNRR